MGSRTQQLLNGLADTSSQDAARLEQLQISLDKLRQGVHVSSVDQETQDCVRRLIGVHEEALCIGTRGRVLRSLSFQDMCQRYEAVDDPHAATFRWIVEETPSIHKSRLESQPEDLSDDEDIASHEDVSVDEDDNVMAMRALAKEKYSRWLRSPDGILHVSGKLGSGKSTLMKLLYQCRETSEGLQEWAGDRTLVSAAFFFWKPGSAWLSAAVTLVLFGR